MKHGNNEILFVVVRDERWITLLLRGALSAPWKQAVRENRRPTKKLLREKTSATMDHCQLSRDTANTPPASTAPGPGPDNLGEDGGRREGEDGGRREGDGGRREGDGGGWRQK